MCSSIKDTELLVGLSYSSLGAICRVCCCPQVSTRVEKWQTILVLEGTTIPEADNNNLESNKFQSEAPKSKRKAARGTIPLKMDQV